MHTCSTLTGERAAPGPSPGAVPGQGRPGAGLRHLQRAEGGVWGGPYGRRHLSGVCHALGRSANARWLLVWWTETHARKHSRTHERTQALKHAYCTRIHVYQFTLRISIYSHLVDLVFRSDQIFPHNDIMTVPTSVAKVPATWKLHGGDGSAQSSLLATTLRRRLQIKFSISSSYSVSIPGQPVQALTSWRHVSSTIVTRVLIISRFVWLDQPVVLSSPVLELDAFRKAIKAYHLLMVVRHTSNF